MTGPDEVSRPAPDPRTEPAGEPDTAPGPGGDGRLDYPGPQLPRGLSRVRGWATVDDRPAARVEILVGGMVVGSGSTGGERPDVAAALGTPEATASGFEFLADFSSVQGDVVTVTVRAVDADGESADVVAREIHVRTPTIDGVLEWPSGDPVTAPPVSRDCAILSGWAVALDGPIDQVEVLVDGQSQGLARIGLPRPDLLDHFPVPHAGLGGFELVLDPEAFARRAGVDVRVVVSSAGCDPLVLTGSITTKPEPRLQADAVQRVEVLRERTSRLLSSLPLPHRDRLNLLSVTHDLGYGGGQLWLSELLDKMGAGRDFPCTVVAPADGPLRPELEELGIRVHITNGYPVHRVETYEGRLAELALWSRAHGHNALLANTFGAFLGADLATRLDVPCVWGIHESWPPRMFWTVGYGPDQAAPLVREAALRALGTARAVVFEAEATRRQYLPGTAPGAAMVVPYGIDTQLIDLYRYRVSRHAARQELGLDDEARIVLVMGTVEPRKAQALITEAFAGVAGDHPEAQLLLVGGLKNAYTEQVKDLVEELGLVGRVTVVPVVSNSWPWYRAADVMVNASDVESLPRSVLDAMCFGLPVAATSVFGLPELITDGENGYLFETRRFGALEGALSRILDASREELERVGTTGRLHVQRFHDSKGYAHDIRALFDGFLADPDATAHDILGSR